MIIAAKRDEISRLTLPIHTPTEPCGHLICFPGAGASASSFKFWRNVDLETLSIHAFQPSGREARYREGPASLEQTVFEAVQLIRQSVPQTQLYLFGHSYGALIAYEVAQKLHHSGHHVARLFVAARTPPHRESRPSLDQLDNDEELVRAMRYIGFDDKGILNHPGLSNLFMKTLRLDLNENAIYLHRHDTALPYPITAISGDKDPVACHDHMAEWDRYSSAGFRHYRVPGSHFFLTEIPDRITQIIAQEVESTQ